MRARHLPHELTTEPPPTWLGLTATLIAVAATTLLVYPLKSVAPVVSLGVVYMPAILIVSVVWGLRLGLLAGVLSVLAFNFFHLPPLHHFTIAEEGNWVALAAFAIAAAISSAVAGLARGRAAEAIEAEALRRSDELKTALLRSVSHDLRTPLTSVIAAGSALGSPSLTPEERSELSAGVVGEGKRLSRLVENLLDLSRLETGKAEPRREPTDVVEVLEAARQSVAGGGLVHVAAEEELPMLDADAAQLERAFANMIENGVRHSGGQPVKVDCRRAGGRAFIRIADRGPGIPEVEWERIFEPFHTGNGSQGGSGLGLAIAKGFVEANGGTIGVEPGADQGTSILVSFPLPEAST